MVALQGPEDLLVLMVNAHDDHANYRFEQLKKIFRICVWSWVCSYLLLPFQQPSISDICNIDTDSDVVYLSDNSCSPNKHILHFFVLFSEINIYFHATIKIYKKRNFQILFFFYFTLKKPLHPSQVLTP